MRGKINRFLVNIQICMYFNLKLFIFHLINAPTAISKAFFAFVTFFSVTIGASLTKGKKKDSQEQKTTTWENN